MISLVIHVGHTSASSLVIPLGAYVGLSSRRGVAQAGDPAPLMSVLAINVVLPAASISSPAERSSSTKLCLRHARQQQHVGDVESWAVLRASRARTSGSALNLEPRVSRPQNT